mmetsp:Transcript_33234/g.38705  ORF Transcript_33234/g.38705 Transcript_33234/m.38705 type:complete len:114 (+) Transcript_33234:37-378(+)
MSLNARQMEEFKTDLDNHIAEKYQNFEELMLKSQFECFNRAGKDAEKFTRCMVEYTRNFEKETERLEFRNMFYLSQSLECLENSKGDDKKVADCKVQTKKNIDSSFAEFFKSC